MVDNFHALGFMHESISQWKRFFRDVDFILVSLKYEIQCNSFKRNARSGLFLENKDDVLKLHLMCHSLVSL